MRCRHNCPPPREVGKAPLQTTHALSRTPRQHTWQALRSVPRASHLLHIKTPWRQPFLAVQTCLVYSRPSRLQYKHLGGCFAFAHPLQSRRPLPFFCHPCPYCVARFTRGISCPRLLWVLLCELWRVDFCAGHTVAVGAIPLLPSLAGPHVDAL